MLVPPDAAKLAVAFESSLVGAEVDLYVRRGLEVRTDDREAGTKPRIVADHESTSPGAGERIVIERGDSPPLANDTCHIGLGVPSSEVDIRGTLTAQIQRSGIAAATPRALAFVSPEGLNPPRQAVRLDHSATGSFRHRIESSQSWLAASPREWARTQRGTTEVAVTVDSAGLSLATHQGKLTVVKADDRDATTGGTPTGIEIPVAFALVPAGGSAGEERNEVSIASYPGNADSCGAGECIRLGVMYTEPVVVSGIPTLALTMESGERLAAWTGSTRSRCGGDWTLGFHYRVRADDTAPGGIGIASDALAPNGGSIRTAAGTEASLAVVSDPASDAKHKVNGRRAPQVESVRITSRPKDGPACGAGEAIDIPVTFDLRVETLGTPSLLLEAGNRYRHASLHRLQWNRVQFRCIVQEEDRDPDGIALASTELFFNGGYIRSVAGTDPIGDLGRGGIGGDGSHKVDGSRASVPEVRRVTILSRPQEGATYGAGKSIEVLTGFDVWVEPAGNPGLSLTVGGRTREAVLYDHVRGNLLFRYSVKAEDSDADGIGIAGNALALNGGSIQSAAGVDARLALGSHAVASHASHKVDGSRAAAPQVSGVWIVGGPHDGETYGVGEPIDAQVNFNITVEVTGSLQLALAVGGRMRQASLRVQHSRSLLFRYIVQADNRDAGCRHCIGCAATVGHEADRPTLRREQPAYRQALRRRQPAPRCPRASAAGGQQGVQGPNGRPGERRSDAGGPRGRGGGNASRRVAGCPRSRGDSPRRQGSRVVGHGAGCVRRGGL